MQMYIVLALLVFMIFMFFTHKVPYGVTTMTCCVVLALTGVMELKDAFSGLSNRTTILIACMFTIAYAFGKTSLINKIRAGMDKIKEKSGLAFVIFLILITVVLAQLMGRTAIVSIIALFLVSLDDEDEICGSRMIFVAFSVLAAWSLKMPVGLGATMAATANAYYEGIITNPEYMLMPMDVFKVSIIPAVALTIYALFAWKLIPKNALDTSGVKEVKKAAEITKRDETIINIIFVAVLLGFVFGTKLGSLMYVIPALGVLGNDFVQLVDAVQKRLHRLHPRGKAAQDVELLRLHRVAGAAGKFQIAQVADLIQDALHRLERLHRAQLFDHHGDISDPAGILVFVAQLHHPVKVAFPLHQRGGGDAAEHIAL